VTDLYCVAPNNVIQPRRANIFLRALMYMVGQKPPPYILLFIVLLYLFTFTNNIHCGLKLYPTYVEAQTELVCQQVVQKITTESKHPNIIMSQWQNTTAIHASAYIKLTAAYNNQKVKLLLFNVPSVNVLLIGNATDQLLC